MAGYIRQDVSNGIANGNVVDADIFDSEFDAIASAFNTSTGHTHDGSSAEGAPITVVGPGQDISVTSIAVIPKTDNTYDLGSASNEWKDLYIDGIANIDTLAADTGTFSGNLTVDTNTLFVDASNNRVGIGTNSPLGLLQVQGQIRSNTTSSTAVVGLRTSLNDTAYTVVGDNLSANLSEFYSFVNPVRVRSPDYIALQTGGTDERMRITSTGNVGIGTASPSEKLSVSGNATVSGTMTVGGSAVTTTTNTQTLTNKTLTSPTITGGTVSGITDLAIADGGTGASTAAGALVNLGLTATAAEINTLDGFTGNVSQLNRLTEILNILDNSILMWKKSLAEIPLGWQLCDGSNGTLDLRDKFVVGAGSTYAVGSTGGAAAVSLTEANLPEHAHTFSGTTNTSGTHNHESFGGAGINGGRYGFIETGIAVNNVSFESGLDGRAHLTREAGAHTHIFSGTTSSIGSGTAHNNLPPYYALCFIQKV